MKNKDTNEAHSDEISVGFLVAQEPQKRSLITRPLGTILILSPTLIIYEAQIGEIETILRDSIVAVTSTLSA